MSVFLTAAVLGLSAGFSPGPLMALVIAQTIRFGVKEGVLAAAAPIITDFPIILISVLVFGRLTQMGPIVGVISLVGGGYILYLAYETFSIKPISVEKATARPQSLLKGVAVNALNPHPYIFWLTVGVPYFLTAQKTDPMAALWFLLPFFGLLVGSKISLALIVGRFRTFLEGRLYLAIMKVLAMALFAFALRLIWDALRRFGLSI
ncbi:MAG: LysE family translocator [Thermodesulfobacteriota bacterium]